MPSITIKELDNTSAGSLQSNDNVVYVPGFVDIRESNFKDVTLMVGAYTPTLCTTVAEFEKFFGRKPATFNANQYYPICSYDEQTGTVTKGFSTRSTFYESEDAPKLMYNKGDVDPSYVYAKELLNLGINVVYERINQDLTDCTVKHFYEALAGDVTYNDEKIDIFENLKDKGEYSVKYITTGGYPSFEYSTGEYTRVEVTQKVNHITSVVPKDTYVPKAPGVPDYFIYSKKKSIELSESVEGVTIENTGLLNIQLLDKIKTGTTLEFTYDANNDWWSATIDSTPTYFTRALFKECGIVVTNDANSNFTVAWENNTSADWNTSITSLTITYESGAAAEGDYFVLTNVDHKGGNAIVNTMLQCAQTRGDCVVLIDHTDIPYRVLDVENPKSVYYAISNENSSYRVSTYGEFGAMLTPWCTYSTALSGAICLPASFGYLCATAVSIANSNPDWLAISGVTRGQVPYFSSTHLDTNRRLTNAIADAYEPRNGIAINSITNIKPYGFVLWGNRTLKNNAIKGNLTATSFLNIRNMVSNIKKVVYTTCKSLTFEQDTDILWANFNAKVSPTLDKMVSGGGIKSYRIVRVATDEKAKMVATIRIVPIYAVEDFEITIELNDDDAIVSES